MTVERVRLDDFNSIPSHAPGFERCRRSEPQSGAALLEELAGFLRRFVVMTDAQRDAVTLWTAHTRA